MEVITKCPICGDVKAVRVNQPGYEAWKRGARIQDALPKLKPEQREMLISGICPTCWANMFKEPEDDERIDLDDERIDLDDESQTRYLDLM